jgi:hypothetical protein
MAKIVVWKDGFKLPIFLHLGSPLAPFAITTDFFMVSDIFVVIDFFEVEIFIGR